MCLAVATVSITRLFRAAIKNAKASFAEAEVVKSYSLFTHWWSHRAVTDPSSKSPDWVALSLRVFSLLITSTSCLWEEECVISSFGGFHGIAQSAAVRIVEPQSSSKQTMARVQRSPPSNFNWLPSGDRGDVRQRGLPHSAANESRPSVKMWAKWRYQL